MVGWAVGCAGMSLKDFDALPAAQFFSIMDQWQKMKKHDEIESLRQMRLLACMLLQPHIGQGKKLEPEDLLKLPGDKLKKVDTMSKEELASRVNSLIGKTNLKKR